jgi:hypothetical protein
VFEMSMKRKNDAFRMRMAEEKRLLRYFVFSSLSLSLVYLDRLMRRKSLLVLRHSQLQMSSCNCIQAC